MLKSIEFVFLFFNNAFIIKLIWFLPFVFLNSISLKFINTENSIPFCLGLADALYAKLYQYQINLNPIFNLNILTITSPKAKFFVFFYDTTVPHFHWMILYLLVYK